MYPATYLRISSYIIDGFEDLVLHKWFNFRSTSPGYEADGELDVLDGMDSGDGSNLRDGDGLARLGLTFPCHVPVEVQQRIWTTLPLEHCIQLFSKTLQGKINRNW